MGQGEIVGGDNPGYKDEVGKIFGRVPPEIPIVMVPSLPSSFNNQFLVVKKRAGWGHSVKADDRTKGF